MPEQKESILVLGAGLVVKPLVQYMNKHGYKVILASRTLAKAEALVKGCTHAVAMKLDIETEEGEKLLDQQAQLVTAIVSLLPYLFHPKAAQYALKYEKHFFTSSYTSDAMRELEQEAKDKNLVFINECGVDPGTDHMSAMRMIDSIRAKGGKIKSFTSFCGGLPHPESNDNPFGYKFSWAPRGVLLASRNTAKFLKDGKDCTIPGEILFDNYEVHTVPDVGEFEGYPNRDSKSYIDVYGIKDTDTIIRGTFRNKGWCKQVKQLVDLGFLSLDEQDFKQQPYCQLVAGLVKSSAETVAEADALKADVAAFLKVEKDATIIKSMEWLGLFSDEPVTANTCLDALCDAMMQRMQYQDGERDMLVMHHVFIAEYADGKQEKYTSSMNDFGIKNGDSSMSRTVSLPLAICIRLVLTGQYTQPGLSIPKVPALYNPILDELEKDENIVFVERGPFPVDA